jgi:hypothetical protein
MTDASLPAARFAEGDFRIGRVFSRTLSVLSRNLLPFCIVTAIASLPNFLFLKVGAGPVGTAAVSPGASATRIAVAATLSMVLSALAQAIVLYGAFEDMRGRPVNLIESTKIGLGRILPVIAAVLCSVILVMLAAILLIIPGLIVITMLFVVTPACVVDRLGPIKSMGRSAELTKGHRWKVFGLWLATMIAGGIVQGVLIKLAATIGGYPLQLLVQFVVGAIWGAFYAILAVVTYHDLRVAKEGVDTDQIAAVFD